MVTVINFSHPLSEAAKDFISRKWCAGDATFIDVACQFNFARPLLAQILDACREAIVRVDGDKFNIDCIIPPGLSFAAAVISREFDFAHIIVVSRQADSIPPVFMPTEFIRASATGHLNE
jgi:hypothetical protein